MKTVILFIFIGAIGEVISEPLAEKVNNRISQTLDTLNGRLKRDMTTTLAELGREFLNRGGVQAIQELMSSPDKTSVLKRVLGTQVTTAVLGQGLLGRLVQSYTGNTNYNPGYPNPGASGYPSPGGNGRWEPAPGGPPPRRPVPSGSSSTGSGGNRSIPPSPSPSGAVNPDDTEY